jgi:hypothetical protein
MKGFEKRGFSRERIWQEFAEREAFAGASSIVRRVEEDFGPVVGIEFGNSLAAEVVAQGTTPYETDPAVAAEVVMDAVQRFPGLIVPMVLPDELFAVFVETGWGLLNLKALEDAGTRYVGAIWHGPDPAWLNTIFSKQKAPCRLVEGRIEWTDDELAGEQPISSSLENLPEIRGELRKVREAFRQATGSEDYNALGARCDRLLKAVGKVAYDRQRDLPPGEQEPGKDDCKRQLSLFFQSRATGNGKKSIRKVAEPLVTAAYDQGQRVKHGQSVERAEAGWAISSICAIIDAVAAVESKTENGSLGE